MSPSLFLFSLLFPLSTKPSFKAQLQSGRLLECVHAFAAEKLERKKKRKKKIGLICKNAACVKRTRDNYVTPHPHRSLLFFHPLPPSPPLLFPHSLYKTTYFILPLWIWKPSGWEMSQGLGNTVVPVNEFGAKPEICFAFYCPVW